HQSSISSRLVQCLYRNTSPRKVDVQRNFLVNCTYPISPRCNPYPIDCTYILKFMTSGSTVAVPTNAGDIAMAEFLDGRRRETGERGAGKADGAAVARCNPLRPQRPKDQPA